MTQGLSTSSRDRAALDLLERSKRVLLTGHERPDGDCVGAQAALARVLSARGVETTILNPHAPDPQFSYLSDVISYGVDTGGPLPEHDLVVLLDCSELGRTGALAPRFSASPAKKLVIDHHILPDEPWWDAAFVDVTASATGLLVHRIAKALGVALDAVAAAGVFTSIVTDTGWFKYSNTDAETLAVAGELCAAGVEPSAVYRAIYQQRSAEHPRRVGFALGRTEMHFDGRLAFTSLPLEASGRAAAMDTEDVLDLLRSVAQVEVVLLVRAVEGNLWKLSARSKTGYDVNALAREFGGGGHAKASGATLSGDLESVQARLLAAAGRGFAR